ncbi:MAG: SpaA isopeptide-forming pilin-related protein [Actinomycetaceae bacterium]|nr:SpaA isopeptide-forming pilin-related protein [Actinomycetaceae bacterium]MDY6143191.1 SpaA isopeptide-forming pilin-related protein [Arcanobacterium sp.]
MAKKVSTWILGMFMLISAFVAGMAAPTPVAEAADPTSTSDLLFLTTTGEILGYDDAGNLIPALPYLPAISLAYEGRPYGDRTAVVSNDRQPVDSPNSSGGKRWDHGPNNDSANWYQIAGLSYNALASSQDGSHYAMLRVDSKTSGGQVGTFQVYKLDPGATYWSKYGNAFSLPSGTVSTASADMSQPAPMGAVNPADGKYYFGSVVKGTDGKYYAHIYRMDATGPTYVGRTEVPSTTSAGNTVKPTAGDISFTSDGSLVIGTSNSDSKAYTTEMRMTLVRAADLLAANGGLMSGSIILPPIVGPFRDGQDTLNAITGYAAMADGSLVTSFKGDGVSPVYVVEDDWSGLTKLSALQPIGGSPELLYMRTSTGGTNRGLCWALDTSEETGSVWNSLTARAPWPASTAQGGMCSFTLHNTQVVDMDGGLGWVPSIDLHKNVVERSDAGDQFKLSISFENGALLHEETTTGTATGEQAVYAGPIPVAAGARLTVSETITTNADLRDYRPTLQCVSGDGATIVDLLADRLTMSNRADGTAQSASASFVVPDSTALGVDLKCTFTNAPKPPTHSITVTKVDSADKAVLAGAQLRLWKDDGDGTLDTNSDTLSQFESSEPVAAGGGVVTTPDTGIAKWNGLEDGTYFVEEVQPPNNYKGADAALMVTVNGADATATLENTKVTGTIIFEKRAKTDGTAEMGPLLSGSEWKLIYPQESGKPPATITDCAAGTEAGTDVCAGTGDAEPTPGIIKVIDLPLGTYTLQETKAPSGYILDGSERSITLDSEEPYTLTGAQAILNEQRTGPELPFSGGVGRDFFLLAGGGTLLAALTVTLITLGRRRTQKLV